MKKVGMIVLIIFVLVASLVVPTFLFQEVVGTSQRKVPTVREIPFKLVYEMGGETVTVEDVYVCKFKGKRWGFDTGRYIKWDGYIKGTGEDRVVVMQDGDYTIEISVGSPEWYMSFNGDEDQVIAPKLWKCGAHGSEFSFREEDDERYDIKILSFTFKSLAGELYNWSNQKTGDGSAS